MVLCISTISQNDYFLAKVGETGQLLPTSSQNLEKSRSSPGASSRSPSGAGAWAPGGRENGWNPIWFEAFRCSASSKSEIRSENFLEKSWRLAVNVLIMTGTSPSKIRKLATPYTFMSYMFGFCIQPVVIRSENKCDHCLWSRSTCTCIIYESPWWISRF